ncbi:MAG: hypothetical protein M0P95_15975 [Sulfuritalea sp.]|jgi:hypothetical protein|nr:hypothetical protein [Sulfuritalea sp.]
MIPPLNEMVGLPPATSPLELDCASERHFQTLLKRAARGETDAQDELVRLRVAYLNWAYPSRKAGAVVHDSSKAGSSDAIRFFHPGLQAGAG